MENLQGFFVTFFHAILCFSNTYRQIRKERVEYAHFEFLPNQIGQKMNMIEILGYVASILVASSFFMKDVVILRTINTFGAIGFVIYGLLLPTYPVAFLNTLVAGANICYIWQALKQKKAK